MFFVVVDGVLLLFFLHFLFLLSVFSSNAVGSIGSSPVDKIVCVCVVAKLQDKYKLNKTDSSMSSRVWQAER